MKVALAIGLSSLLLAGCASNLSKPEDYSGFLKDYSRLKEAKSPSGAPVMRWIDPQLDSKAYTSVYIEPTQLYPKPAPTAQIPATTLKGITDYYDQALKRELGKSLPLASKPGPGVIVVRAAITAVSSDVEGLKPYEVIPIALVVAAASTAAGSRDRQAEIATEAVFLDGGNQKVVAQVVRKGTGKELENDKTVLRPDDVRPVIDGWAIDLHESWLKLKGK